MPCRYLLSCSASSMRAYSLFSTSSSAAFCLAACCCCAFCRILSTSCCTSWSIFSALRGAYLAPPCAPRSPGGSSSCGGTEAAVAGAAGSLPSVCSGGKSSARSALCALSLQRRCRFEAAPPQTPSCLLRPAGGSSGRPRVWGTGEIRARPTLRSWLFRPVARLPACLLRVMAAYEKWRLGLSVLRVACLWFSCWCRPTRPAGLGSL